MILMDQTSLLFRTPESGPERRIVFSLSYDWDQCLSQDISHCFETFKH